MAYRGQDEADRAVAPTSEGPLEVTLGANRIALTVGPRSLHLVDRVATVSEVVGNNNKARRVSFTLTGLVFARGYPREDVGLWIEAVEDQAGPAGRLRTGLTAARRPPPAPPEGSRPGARDAEASPTRTAGAAVVSRPVMRRIFGVTPVSLLEPDGLKALSRLDALAHTLRHAVEDHVTAVGVWGARGLEIGSGHDLDKVLFADRGDHHAVYARRLFRDRARLLATFHEGGRVVVPDGSVTHEVRLTSKYAITVRGDYIRFADEHGVDQARIAVPWVSSEDREELARRMGQLVVRRA